MDKLTTPRNRFALPWGPRKTYPQIAQIYADFGEGLDVKVEDGFSNPSIIYFCKFTPQASSFGQSAKCKLKEKTVDIYSGSPLSHAVDEWGVRLKHPMSELITHGQAEVRLPSFVITSGGW
jgi:hypothetical protein